LVAPGLETVKLAFSGVGLGGTGVGEAGIGVGEAGTGVGAGACAAVRGAPEVGVTAAGLVGVSAALGLVGIGVYVGRCVLIGAGVGVGACPTRRLAHAVRARATIIRIKTRNCIELSPFLRF